MARELEREIVDEREPGERLGTKDDLRKRFRVAVATVNEAVRLLETRGMIEARPGPGGGVFVTQPAARVAFSHMVLGFKTGSTSYEECLEVRDALEPLIDSHAARYHRVSDIRELNRIVKGMEAAMDDPAAFFKCNWALHRRIAELCRNTPLRSMYLTLIDFLSEERRSGRVRELRRRRDGCRPSRPDHRDRRRRGPAPGRSDRGAQADRRSLAPLGQASAATLRRSTWPG